MTDYERRQTRLALQQPEKPVVMSRRDILRAAANRNLERRVSVVEGRYEHLLVSQAVREAR
jgi:hypothetical protein